MQAVVFYLVYPVLYLVASLPFGALYKLSDFFYLVLRLSGYRRGVVVENLRNSFPEKTDQEIAELADKYFRYLCDLILETLKTLTMDEKEARARCTFHGIEMIDALYQKKQSFIIAMGHIGNWEWAGPSFSLNNKHQLVVIYRPLSNPYFEKMMVGMRTRWGTMITPVSQTLRDMVSKRKMVTATALIADQSAFGDLGYWTTFLHQDTVVFTGPEKLAIKFNYPIVFLYMRRPKRGYYEVFAEMLIEEPTKTVENQISEAFIKRLEKEILVDPTIWLWSHRRWKYKRSDYTQA
ncbi:MAG TPA: lysophospholipid acyltransferase family protein [Cyclobacteriaceae bacterium]|nr:lysophospholipid acyltransferase family protein [Cyclobacteriaceae bacterium]